MEKDKKVYYKSLILGLVITFILCFFDISYAIGMLAGMITFMIYMRLLMNSISAVIDSRHYAGILNFFGSILRMMILVVPLVVALLLPKYVNLIAVVVGELLFKFSLYFVLAFQKK